MIVLPSNTTNKILDQPPTTTIRLQHDSFGRFRIRPFPEHRIQVGVLEHALEEEGHTVLAAGQLHPQVLQGRQSSHVITQGLLENTRFGILLLMLLLLLLVSSSSLSSSSSSSSFIFFFLLLLQLLVLL